MITSAILWNFTNKNYTVNSLFKEKEWKISYEYMGINNDMYFLFEKQIIIKTLING